MLQIPPHFPNLPFSVPVAKEEDKGLKTFFFYFNKGKTTYFCTITLLSEVFSFNLLTKEKDCPNANNSA